MKYEIFEGRSKVRKVRKKKDTERYESALIKLGFKEELDFVSFCSALGLYLVNLKNYKIHEESPSLKEVAMMQSFKKAKLYDFLIINFLNIKEKRLEEFEKYFYSGFSYLIDELDEWGADCQNQLETFCQIFDEVLGEK